MMDTNKQAAGNRVVTLQDLARANDNVDVAGNVVDCGNGACFIQPNIETAKTMLTLRLCEETPPPPPGFTTVP